ncbi:MAG: DUF6464 family protein [Nostoc sp.]|uniref:DUF6464 family protein n=1 Tax=Nostoc sp. TaxID=1180 RepID=UPI002FFC7BE4
MNQIERVEEGNYTLHLWSDATHEVNVNPIKSLLNLVTQQLGFYSQIDARYYHFERRWQIRFSWQSEPSGRQSFEQILDHSQLACANATFLERLALDLGDRIRRSVVANDSQNWVIVRWRDGFLAGIHQAGRASVTLILYSFTQHTDFASNHPKVTIEAWIPGNAIVRGGGVEVDGMLLQGELLEWLKIGEERRFRFSPNTQQALNMSGSSPDEIRITFTTCPKNNRLASFGRIAQMIEQGQIEILRSGYFDRWLGSPPYLERPIELPRLPRREGAIVSEENRRSFGRLLDEYDDIHADSDYVGLGLRTCKYNAGSRMLRCAVNPCGPCEGCQHYEKI